MRVWPAVLDGMRQAGAPAFASMFEGARPVEIDQGDAVLKIGFPTSDTFNKRKAEAPEKRDQLAEALATVIGVRLRPVFVLLEGEDAPTGEPVDQEVDHEALVEKLKSEFNAEEVG